MYWSDWGNHPKIETAAMDGTLRETLVQDNIQWPTGLWRPRTGGGRGRFAKVTQKRGARGGQLTDGRRVWKLFQRSMGSGCGNRGGGPRVETVLLLPSRGLTRSVSPGLAVDYHNERLYWADAKLSVIGSIRLNGTDPIVAADGKRGACPTAAVATPTSGLHPLLRAHGLPVPAVLPSPAHSDPLAHLSLHSLHR